MFWFILFMILMYLLLNSSRRKANAESWQEYYDTMHQFADQIEYGKRQQEVNRINEKYKLKEKNNITNIRRNY